MTPADNAVSGRFYGTLKVHKEHDPGKAPPLQKTLHFSWKIRSKNKTKHITHSLRTHHILKTHTRNKHERKPEKTLILVKDVAGLHI